MTYLLGCDLSSYNPVSDWDLLRSKCSFLVTRASKGSTGVDSAFQTIWDGAKQHNFLRGAYHLFIPKVSAKDQADNLLKIVKDRPDIPFVVDAELPANLNDLRWGVCSPLEITNCVWDILTRIEQKTARIPELYSRADWINTWLLPIKDWSHFGLHVARYGTTLPWWEGDHYKPKYWDEWDFWQFQADSVKDGHAYGLGCDAIDLDYWQGTEDELKVWCGLQPVQVPPVTLEDRVARLEIEARARGWPV